VHPHAKQPLKIAHPRLPNARAWGNFADYEHLVATRLINLFAAFMRLPITKRITPWRIGPCDSTFGTS
jgi:hypothetical protein